jgi:hypothetical protein
MGFSIKNGKSTYGGGIYCSTSSPTITNCTISGNTATSNGRRSVDWIGMEVEGSIATALRLPSITASFQEMKQTCKIS